MTPTLASGFFDFFHGVVLPVFRGETEERLDR